MSFIVNTSYEYGQIAAFFSGKKSRFCFIAVVHCFNQNKVCARFCADAYAFGKNFNRFFKRHIAERFKHFAERTDIKRNISIVSLASCFCVFYCGVYDFFKVIKFKAICTKGASCYYVCARIEIELMHFNNFFGASNIPFFGLFSRHKSP